ncbi:MAG: hypothetical protein CVV23_04160 [Ignavibacteriae bacterium HGW-Ignavibacteriae-2]|jgi:hemoglobin/transferrin/lactoferrin receptor protein|nr:MAG: hypothetical protein CVV23_04160 [Ignavibacteriae bacterium HGW-Ignavibacteriae-2]
MKKNLFSLFFVLLATSLVGKNFSITGTIYNANNNFAVADANVLLSEKYFSTSNESGKFIFNNVAKGEYLLKVTHINYREKSITIKIESDTLLSIYLLPDHIELENITVTSSKYEKNINDLSYSASFITKTKIEKEPHTTLAELLQYEPGLSIIREGGWGTELSIRGLNRSNIVTLVDGNRIETATDLSARLSLLDLNDIERVELIKGAASSLYGSGATGGIINIISKSGYYGDQFYFSGNFNSGFNSVNNNFSNGITLFSGNEYWYGKITTSYRKAGNTMAPSGEIKNSQFTDYSLNASVGVKTFSDQEIKFDFQQFKALDVGIPGGSALFTDQSVVRYPQEIRKMLSVEYKFNDLTSSFNKLSIKYFHQYIFRDVENIPGIVQNIAGSSGQPSKRVSVLSIKPSADHIINGFQSQANFTINKNNYLIAGLDFWRRNYSGERIKNQTIEMIDPSTGFILSTINKSIYEKPLPDAEFNSAGIYAQDDIQIINNKLSLSIGSRYDYIWISNEETFNPVYETNNGVINNKPGNQSLIWAQNKAKNNSYAYNLGVLYSPNNLITFTLNGAHSFRSPSLEERFQYIDLGSVVKLGNAQLKPEVGNFIDLGLRLQNEKLIITSSIFFNSLTNLVTDEPSEYENRYALVKTNVGKAELFGFETALKYQVFKNYLLYGNVSYVRGKDIHNNSDLPQISPFNGILGIKTKIINWMEIDFTSVLFDSQNKVADGEITTPGYVYFNLYCNTEKVNLANTLIRFSFGVENLLNKEYRNHLSTSRGLIRSEAGRNIYVKINLTWQ